MSRKNQFFLGNLDAGLFGIGLVGCGSGPTESAAVSDPAESAAQTGSAAQIVLEIATAHLIRLLTGIERPLSQVIHHQPLKILHAPTNPLRIGLMRNMRRGKLRLPTDHRGYWLHPPIPKNRHHG